MRIPSSARHSYCPCCSYVPLMPSLPQTFLVVLGDQAGVSWVLEHRIMALERHRARMARPLSAGTELLLYVTRGAFNNPGRDKGRVIGAARVTNPPGSLAHPVTIRGRCFEVGFDFELASLTPRGRGVDLASFVGQLDAFPIKHAWSTQLRKPLLAMPDHDAALLRRELRVATRGVGLAEAAATYRWPPA